MTDTDNSPVIETHENPETVDNSAIGGEQTETLDFVLDKYRAEDRSEQESAYEQAKAYSELQKKFGGFTGAPEAYELKLDEVAEELGVEINTESPVFGEMMELAKELNMSGDAFNQFTNLWAKNAIAIAQAEEQNLHDEFNNLKNADDRIGQVNGYLEGILGEQTEALQSAIKTAEQFEALEMMVGMMKGTEAMPQDANQSTVTESEVHEMQFAKDQYGGRRIHTDQAFRREYEAKLKQLHGTQPYNQKIG